jgi:hypothetical protein
MSIFGFLRKKTKDKSIPAKPEIKVVPGAKLKDTIGGPYLIDGIVRETVSIDRKDDGKVYEIWQGNEMETAIAFLRSIPTKAFRHLYYVIVETPSGNAGKDCDGMFDETTGRSIS